MLPLVRCCCAAAAAAVLVPAVVAAPAATAAERELRGQWHLDQAPRAPLPAAKELVSAEP